MAKVKQVALAFPIAPTHDERILRGIVDYTRQHQRWMLTYSPETYAMSIKSLKGWRGAGVIADINTKAEARIARELALPVVNVSGVLDNAGLPRVATDPEAVGRLAAEHLLDCGFQRFAYYGLRNVWSAQQRGWAFRQRVVQDGYTCSVLEASGSYTTQAPWRHWLDQLQQWLKTLKPPVGMFAAHDHRARLVLDMCDQIGLRVPDDVAVIGVNDDQLFCEFSQPPLTSILRNDWKFGYEAAALLDRLMAGKRPSKQDILITPQGVVPRQSTDVVTVEDPDIATAVRFIREHVDEWFGVERLLKFLPVSRRWLERQFKQHLGRTPNEFIYYTRVQRAKQLLTGPKKLSLKEVADACGFSETRRLRLVFRRITGSTPAEYRRAHQTGRQ